MSEAADPGSHARAADLLAAKALELASHCTSHPDPHTKEHNTA